MALERQIVMVFFTIYSYRDPNTKTTLEHFSNASYYIIDRHYSQKDINEAILKTFSDIDTPKPPSKEGIVEFLTGLTDEMRQNYRNELLNINKDELADIANRYLATLTEFSSPSYAIFGGQNYDQFKNEGNWTIYKFDNELKIN